jgi:hypothetical protein
MKIKNESNPLQTIFNEETKSKKWTKYIFK